MQHSKQKSVTITTVLMALALIVVVGCGAFYLNRMNLTIEKETRQTLNEAATQSAAAFSRQVEGDFQTLKMIAAYLGAQPELTVSDTQDILSHNAQESTFKRMGVITPDGQAHTSDNVEMFLGDRDYFKRAFDGETVVSQPLEDIVDGKRIYVYATPVQHDGKITSVLFATNDAENYRRLLDVRPFSGAGYCYLLDSDGDVLMRDESKESVRDMDNIFDMFAEEGGVSDTELARVREEFRTGVSGMTEYTRDGVGRYMSYTPAGINEWVIVSIVSSELIAQKTDELSRLTLMVCCIIFAVVVGLFIQILYTQVKNRKKLRNLAYTDDVTGGSNWNKFLIDARATLDAANSEEYTAVIFDIDKFAVINDLFGREEGDLLLQCIWRVLRESLQEDEPFGRVSADNFDILMRYQSEEETAQRLMEISRKISRYCEQAMPRYTLHLSFGICHITDPTQVVGLLFDRASIARRTVKNHHGVIAFYDHEIRDQIVEEKRIENEMEGALHNGEFVVYFQPKYSISKNAVVGAEALVRWVHPEMGVMQPGTFIPVFEKNGFIITLDSFVMQKVCETIRGWIDAGIRPVPVAVNLSREHLKSHEFPQNVINIARANHIPRDLIVMELTESTVFDFQNTGRLVEIMETLRKAGFTLSMDDFGSGYSSLNLLRELPVDELKLDRGFFGETSDQTRGETLVADIVSMAKHLNMEVVAEGIETREQVDFLASVGCDTVQGYFYSRPIPIADFERLRSAEVKSDKLTI